MRRSSRNTFLIGRLAVFVAAVALATATRTFAEGAPQLPDAPPLDSLVRSFVSFEVLPAQRCPGDSLRLELKKNGCHACVHLASFDYDTAAALRAVVVWTPECAERACIAESLSVALGAFAAGSFVVNVPVDVHVLGTANADSVISFVQQIAFEVPQGCNGAPCVEGYLPAREPFDLSCAATLAPGDTATLVLTTRTGLEIWEAQCSIGEYFPLRILDVHYAGAAPGTSVTRHRDGQLVRLAVSTTGGLPIVPVGRHDFLRVTVAVDPSVRPDQTVTWLSGGIEQAWGRGGGSLDHCVHNLRDAPPSLRICIASANDTCDANGDGRTDVRDLVRMVRCLRPDTTGADSARTCPDCNADGSFDLGDLFCCARHILRAPQLPRDSAQVSDAVFVSLGQLRPYGNGWLVPVRVHGAGPLAGSLLRLRYPAERWRAEPPAYPASRTEVNSGWISLGDLELPGVAQVGWLKLGEEQSSELSFEFVLTPIGDPRDHDILSVEGADLVLPDGSTLTPVGDLPAVSLIAPFEPPHVPSSLELGPARPNPFTNTTSFLVSLPRESMIELTVHDVAGRLVATLARGRFAAGFRPFTWDGAGARDGVYFARLSVDGRMLSQRVALLRGGH